MIDIIGLIGKPVNGIFTYYAVCRYVKTYITTTIFIIASGNKPNKNFVLASVAKDLHIKPKDIRITYERS